MQYMSTGNFWRNNRRLQHGTRKVSFKTLPEWQKKLLKVQLTPARSVINYWLEWVIGRLGHKITYILLQHSLNSVRAQHIWMLVIC